ncbi:RNA polymerase sigma-70 factor [Desertivirga xinjiangensis]|uniref:RNA polymerase sigma-70 factor n=1 Tax=Desertivirga xinjiangensis TaxID=539206 RepID=UPI002109FFC0|nr:RNA polymerase sigma-70 factor [Pedobacter xinjiangensis]
MRQIAEDDYILLLLSASEGNERAFASLFYKYSPALMSFAKKFTHNSDEAEEILQNVFLRVWLHRDKLPEIDNIKSWLYKFVANESLAYIRKKTTRAKTQLHFQSKASISYNDIEQTVNANELKDIVAQAVNSMPEQRRKIFNLSRTEGLTILEISEQLNISQSTVKNTLVTALKFIRDYLKAYGYSSFVFIALILS